MSGFDPGSWLAIAPELMLAATALIVLMLHSFKASKSTQTLVAAVGIFATAGVVVHCLSRSLPMTLSSDNSGIGISIQLAWTRLFSSGTGSMNRSWR